MENKIAKIEFSNEQIDLIKRQIANGCTNDELAIFMHQCKRTGLDPLTRQIYAIKRAGRMTIQTSIDGFRVIAERSGTYGGQDEPTWTYNADGSIINCTVKVYRFRGDVRYPAGVGVAFFKEYYPNPVNLQKTLAHTMIAKVAEALALRKAFPQDLSGLYTNDEMQQADVVVEDMITTEQQTTINILLDEAKISPNNRTSIEEALTNGTYTKKRAYECINWLNSQIDVDLVGNGSNYNQTDILNKLKEV